jgi:nucleoside-diphosphate kinase
MNQTLAILKPDAYQRQLIGTVLDFILKKGFKIKALKMVHLTPEDARRFYAIHNGRHFFDGLIEFMTSGPCFPMVLEKDNAVQAFREIIGATDPAEAVTGSLRRLYAENNRKNIIHGSDSEENAQKEIAFFFPLMEIME